MTSDSPDGAAFVTTQWTRVLAARGESVDARVALGDLCGAYYEPVVACLRVRFRDEDRARELAHEFFARMLARDSLAGVDPHRGRFRSYMLGAVKHFLADKMEREGAMRRGAGVEHIAIGMGTDTSPGVDPPASGGRSPEQEFDRQWALTLLSRALTTLEDEHKSEERRRVFVELKPWLTGENAVGSQRDVAGRLGMNESAVKVAIHRMRKRFRELVKDEIARTVEDPALVPDEMNYLVTVLTG